jgi:hypothetical protein
MTSKMDFDVDAEHPTSPVRPFGPWAVDQGTQPVFKRIFARLREELPEYEFLESFTPFHSSYDAWHFFGLRRQRASSFARKKSASESRASSERTKSVGGYADSDETEKEKDNYVVVRVSEHSLRLEREYKLLQKLVAESDPDCRHVVKPLQFARLPPRLPGDVAMSVCQTHGCKVIERPRHLLTLLPPRYPSWKLLGVMCFMYVLSGKRVQN